MHMRIRKAREEQGYTREWFAELLDVSVSYMAEVERGRTGVSVKIRNPEPVFHSLSIMESRIREKLTPEALANSVYLSRYHYQRMFREAMGESVMRYITRRRLTLAARDLTGASLSILEIALRLRL